MASVAIHAARWGRPAAFADAAPNAGDAESAIIRTPCGRGLIAFDGLVRRRAAHADALAAFGWEADGAPVGAPTGRPNGKKSRRAKSGPRRRSTKRSGGGRAASAAPTASPDRPASAHALDVPVDASARIVLARLLQQGPDGLKSVDGDFAFTAIDFRRRVVMIGRDRWGVRPLYWWAAPWGGIAVASEIKAFTALPQWAARLNPPRAWDFLRYGVLDHTDETLFADVRHAEPGVVLTLPLPGCVQSPRLAFGASDAAPETNGHVVDIDADASAPAGTPTDAPGRAIDAAASQRWASDVAHVAAGQESAAGGGRRFGRLGRRGRGSVQVALRHCWFNAETAADESRLTPGKSLSVMIRQGLAASIMRRFQAARGVCDGNPAAGAVQPSGLEDHAASAEEAERPDPSIPGVLLSGGLDAGAIAVLLSAAMRHERTAMEEARDRHVAGAASPITPLSSVTTNADTDADTDAADAESGTAAGLTPQPPAGPGRPAVGWTWATGSRRDDDFGSAKASAGAAGMHQERLSAREYPWTDAVDDMIWRHDEPPATPAFFARAAIAAAASDAGATVLFDGTGADEVLGGSPWAHRSVRAGLLRRGSLRDLVTGVASVRPGRTIPVTKQLRRAVERSLPGPGAILEDAPSGAAVELARGSRAADPVSPSAPNASRENPFARMAGLRRGLRACSVELLRRASLPQQLHAIDRAASGSGIHVDLPYLCPDFVALALALPDSRKIADGRSKLALRQGMVGRLPTLSLRHEHRPPFETNLDEWLDAERRPQLRQWIQSGQARAGALFRSGVLSRVRSIVDAPREASDRDQRLAWRTLMFLRWIDRFDVRWD